VAGFTAMRKIEPRIEGGLQDGPPTINTNHSAVRLDANSIFSAGHAAD
jgi:hypothetical protein